MKLKLGIALIVVGALLVCSALGLVIYNDWEQRNAGAAVNEVMPEMVEVIKDRLQAQKESRPVQQPTEPETPTDSTAEHPEEPPETLPPETEPVAPTIPEMPVVDIKGHGYIGFVGIPTLQKELPVMAGWTYPKLKISPCRYTGSVYTDDMVIMAHNYSHHFGTLQNLRTGDVITFTDMNGVTVRYEVVALDILQPTAVEEMTSGEFDLTLFTCTYGGKTRVTVRCDRIRNS